MLATIEIAFVSTAALSTSDQTWWWIENRYRSFSTFQETNFLPLSINKTRFDRFFRITTKQIFDRKKQIKLEVKKNVREEITRIDDDKKEQRERYNGRKPGIASAA